MIPRTRWSCPKTQFWTAKLGSLPNEKRLEPDLIWGVDQADVLLHVACQLEGLGFVTIASHVT